MNKSFKTLATYFIAGVIGLGTIKFIDNNRYSNRYCNENKHTLFDTYNAANTFSLNKSNTIALLIDMELGFKKNIDSLEYETELQNQLKFIKNITKKNI